MISTSSASDDPVGSSLSKLIRSEQMSSTLMPSKPRSAEVDEVEIMDNILQQSGNLQVDDDDDDVVNIEYVSTASAAQAICNICNFLGTCPTDSASGVYKQKSYILENLEELLKCFLKDQIVEKLEKLKQTSILSFFSKK